MLIVLKSKNVNIENNGKDMFVLNKICDLKKLNDEKMVILLYDLEINEIGVIEELNLYFEELLITLQVDAIITTKINNKLLEISNFYNILLLVIEKQ